MNTGVGASGRWLGGMCRRRSSNGANSAHYIRKEHRAGARAAVAGRVCIVGVRAAECGVGIGTLSQDGLIREVIYLVR